MNIQPPNEDVKTTTPLTEITVTPMKIGRTTYIITEKFKQDAREGLVDKVLRLIRDDVADTD
jgi:hypothetical protein